jgi:hypothetical protein
MMFSEPPPSDSMPASAEVADERGRREQLFRFIRAGAWAAIVSGLAVAVSLLLEWLVVPYERLGIAAYLTGWYFLSAALRLLSAVLLVWAVIGLYERQSRAAGTFGLWAFVVAFFGSVLQACESWGETFLWPTMAHVAPKVMSGEATEAPKYLFSGIALSNYSFFLGWTLFGVSTLFSARVYPRWAGVLLIVAIPVTAFLSPTPGTFQESIGQILFGIAVAALGFYALRAAPSKASSSPRRA